MWDLTKTSRQATQQAANKTAEADTQAAAPATALGSSGKPLPLITKVFAKVFVGVFAGLLAAAHSGAAWAQTTALAASSAPAASAGVAGVSDGLPSWVSSLATVLLVSLSAVMVIYAIRHYVFTLNRLFSPQRSRFEGLHDANWPHLVVFVAAHNEEQVVGHCLEALVSCDYPQDRLTIIPVNDRSKDRTREICDEWAARFPALIKPFHRTDGKAGKPAALMDAAALAKEIAPLAQAYAIFDADYVPGRGLLKQIVAPLLDPLVGVTMGRVVPGNSGFNLLTRLLDMERSAGYQGDQQARQNLGSVPQFGGTVGAIKVRALDAVGGFRQDVLAEDTDLTFRMLDAGWTVHYVNTAECIEEVPQAWPVRMRQLQRWAKGHNQVMAQYLLSSATNLHLSRRQRLESVLLLGCYSVAPLTLLGWALVLLSYLSNPGWVVALAGSTLALVVYGAFGNSAAFFQTAAAVRLDGNARRLHLLPLNFLGYVVSAVVITRGTVQLLVDTILKRELRWDKTVRYRQAAPAAGQPQPTIEPQQSAESSPPEAAPAQATGTAG